MLHLNPLEKYYAPKFTSELRALITARNEATAGITARVEQLKETIASQGLLQPEKAERLTADLLQQLEERIALEAGKKAVKSA